MEAWLDPSTPRWRAARDRSFCSAIFEHRYDPHVEPLNRLVDALSSEPDGRWAPYVAPTYGGVQARVLLHLQDPGPATHRDRGSGFLCHLNDDPSAELLARGLDAVDLPPSWAVSWNAYPWFRTDQRARPSAGQVEEGLNPLRRVLGLLVDLRAVLLMGTVAQDSWRRLLARHPSLGSISARNTVHTSGRGITSGGQHGRAEGIERLHADLAWARAVAEI